MTTETNNKTATVYGSYGNLTIDTVTGQVLSVEHAGDTTEYADIVKFDLDEYKKHYGRLDDNYDICDLCFWAYHQPAEDFRTEKAKGGKHIVVRYHLEKGTLQ